MTITDLLTKSKKTAFSFEILPPLKGNSIDKVYTVVDKLREFDPQYINITTHHSECVYRAMDNGMIQKSYVRKRPGTVAIAAAIQQRYKIPAVPHIICKGFSREETEYALIDLNFLEIYNLLLLRGDANKLDGNQENQHAHATELLDQVNDFNRGIALDGTSFEQPAVAFSYGVAGYPEKHEEAPNMDSDIYYLKEKVKKGAGYIVTQMFFDNEKYFAFVDRCRREGIMVPVIPGIKPIVLKDQLTILPKIFRSDIPEALAVELRKCKTDEDARTTGTEWCIHQCKELIERGVPSLHFYTLMASESVRQIAKEIY
ncbi:MAG: methylenetetrahydrofolate reductase [Dysgonamonadaceae bacterium]|jgi:methylenetetrahydrofolate reductase (NADPH)|nr:methylenetetrahydrofolate reductase [Dysgonamonadaceae bacterium]